MQQLYNILNDNNYYEDTYMNRRESRTSAMKLIFQIPFELDKTVGERTELFLESGGELDGFATSLYEGVYNNLADIDSKIEPHLQKWSFDRLSKISVAVLRLSSYEILYTDIPVQAAINEAVELMKTFDEQKSAAFVNGVLGKIASENGKL